ncbi:hypothetical protein, partial [Prevotella sp.]|uniref:hypothetical protein n=1 Tax=Prevotella sp. TaxID=59823 RepID=UPI0025D9764F
IYLVILGFFALQKDYYCYATVVLLRGKCTTTAWQISLEWSAKVVLFEQKGAFFQRENLCYGETIRVTRCI